MNQTETATKTEIIVAVRPTERQDCQDIYNLSRARAQLSIIQSTATATLTGDDDGQVHRLMSAKELERDGFDTTPPLFHCLVATTTTSSVIIGNQHQHASTEEEEAEGDEQEQQQREPQPQRRWLTKNNDESHEKVHNYHDEREGERQPDLASSSSLPVNSGSIVVGYALYFIAYPVWEGKSIQLADLCVDVDPKHAFAYGDKDREGQRIGRALLAELARIAIDGGYADIRLVCQESDQELVKLVEGNHGVNFGKKEDWNWFTIDGAGLRALTSDMRE